MDSLKPEGYRRLTIEQLKQFPGYENVSDTEAEKIIDALERYAIITLQLYQKWLKLEQHERPHFT